MAQRVKKSACNAGDWVQSLGQEDPLEKEMATHFSILAWRIPMDRGAWWATVHGVTRSQAQVSGSHTHTDGAAQPTTKGSWAAPTAQAAERLGPTPSGLNLLLKNQGGGCGNNHLL